MVQEQEKKALESRLGQSQKLTINNTEAQRDRTIRNWPLASKLIGSLFIYGDKANNTHTCAQCGHEKTDSTIYHSINPYLAVLSRLFSEPLCSHLKRVRVHVSLLFAFMPDPWVFGCTFAIAERHKKCGCYLCKNWPRLKFRREFHCKFMQTIGQDWSMATNIVYAQSYHVHYF